MQGHIENEEREGGETNMGVKKDQGKSNNLTRMACTICDAVFYTCLVKFHKFVVWEHYIPDIQKSLNNFMPSDIHVRSCQTTKNLC